MYEVGYRVRMVTTEQHVGLVQTDYKVRSIMTGSDVILSIATTPLNHQLD